MDCVRRGVFPARGGLLSPRTSPSRERVHATSLPNDDRARIAGCTPASRWALVGMRCQTRRGSEEVGRGTRTSPCAPRRHVREGVCAVDIGHDAALRGSAFVMQRGCHGARPTTCLTFSLCTPDDGASQQNGEAAARGVERAASARCGRRVGESGGGEEESWTREWTGA